MIEVRRYKSEDKAAVWELHNEALAGTGGHPGSGEWDEDMHHIEDVYLNDGGEFLVGEADGEIVAMGALKRVSNDTAEVKRMRVRPGCQRKGYGREILKKLEERGRELGYKILKLDTTTKQLKAQKFYMKNGYRETGREKFKSDESFVLICYEKGI